MPIFDAATYSNFAKSDVSFVNMLHFEFNPFGRSFT